jgi:trimethylamine--corrinoid protein Co-methyltransferase
VINDVLHCIDQHKAQLPTPDEPSPQIQPIVSGQGIWYSDVETDQLRLATRDDLATLSRIVDALPGNVGRGHPTFIPQDVPLPNCELHAYATIILNASRPHRVSVYSRRALDYFVEISDVVYGSRERTIAEAPFATKMWITTPFGICAEDIEIAMAARRLLERPVIPGCMPVAGVSTPVTLAGALAQTVAESLMLDALCLALNGRINGTVPGPLVTDMRMGSSCEAGPDNALVKLGAAQMCQYIYGHAPVTDLALTTMAKCPGPQAVMEKMGNALMGVLTGARNYSAVGTLASTDIGSFVQLMIDLEITSFFERLLQGIRVAPETIAEEVIKQVVPSGARYLEHPHTLTHFRDELWLPQLADRRLPAAWREDPTTMVGNARARASHLMDTATNRCPLDERQKAEIRRILEAADREVA